MAANPDFYFLEQTDFSVRLARCSVQDRTLSVDALKEVPASEAAALLATLSEGATVLCAVRPKLRALHLATADEARKFSGPIGLRKFGEICSVSNKSMTWLAAVHARDGGPPANTPWILSGAADLDPLATGTLESLHVKPVRSLSATLLTAGALAATVEHAVLMIEVGELVSHAMLISREGVLAAGALSLDLPHIAEAIQTELKLKFRGSAAKLFLNPDYDFTETGPKIAANLAEALKSELARFVVDRPAPTALFVSGLPADQNWFGPELATALKLGYHAPDLQQIASAGGLKLATGNLPVPPAWLALFHLIKLHSDSTPLTVAPWEADWTPVSDPVPVPAAGPANPPPAAVLPPEPAPAPVIPPPASASAPSPAVKPQAAKPAPPPAAPPTKKSLIAAAYSAQSSAKADPTAASPKIPAGVVKTPATTSGKPAPRVPTKPPFSTAPFSPRKRRRPSRLVIIIIILVAAALAFFSYRYFKHAEAERIAAEKNAAELRLKAEETRARIAAKKSEEEAAAQRQREADAARKVAEEERARQQAEEARAQAAARVANARGTLLVATKPSGAFVTVGSLPARTSPARFADLKVGKYPVVVSLAGHEDARFELSVQENAVTDAGVITLMPLIGSLKINSEPGVAHYELRPANVLMPAPELRRSGETPANLEDLPVGDYDVVLNRDGWSPHTQVVSISKGATTYLRWSWPNALVKINSTPEGADVSLNGKSLGLTPLTLSDQTPGDVRYEITLDHFEPVPLSAKLEAGQETSLDVIFKPEDRVFTAGEVDRKPETIGAKQPELPYYLTLESGRVELQVTVLRDGTVKNVTVLDATNPELGKYTAAAVAKWPFKPGAKAGVPVNVSVKLPFVFKGK